MSCIDVQDSLVEYLLGELDAQRRASVEMHLENGCSECRAELQALTESADLLWQAVPNKQLSKELQREIVLRVCAVKPASEIAEQTTIASHPASLHAQLVRNPFAQAFLAFAAGILFMMYMKPGDKVAGDIIANRPPILKAGSSVNLASPRIPASLQMSEKKYESTQLVSLRRKPGSSELRGHVLCDALTREIHVFCHGLLQPPIGTQYVLWLIGPGIEIRAVDRLEVDSEGVCKAAVHWPEGDFRFAKVTLEVSSKLNSKPSNEVELTSNSFEPFTY